MKKSLDEIIVRAARGKAVSDAYVQRTVRSFIYGKLEKALPDDRFEEEIKENADFIRKQLGVLQNDSDYLDSIRLLYNKAASSHLWDMEDMYTLCILFCSDDNPNPFYSLAVEDYLEMAGMDEVFEVYFREEAERFEKEHDRALSIGSLGYDCMEFLLNRPEFKFHAKEDKWLNQEEAKVCRVLKQIWYLLVEAPMKWEGVLADRLAV